MLQLVSRFIVVKRELSGWGVESVNLPYSHPRLWVVTERIRLQILTAETKYERCLDSLLELGRGEELCHPGGALIRLAAPQCQKEPVEINLLILVFLVFSIRSVSGMSQQIPGLTVILNNLCRKRVCSFTSLPREEIPVTSVHVMKEATTR